MSELSSREAVLLAAKRTAMAHGYAGLNFRDIAAEVGMKAPSIYHHFPTKADLGAAVARRYWEDIGVDLERISATAADALHALARYPEVFRASLLSDNRMCLISFMAAEYDDLPDTVKAEVANFAEVNVAWLARKLAEAKVFEDGHCEALARAIYAAIAGAQLLARSRSNIQAFDDAVDTFRSTGLLPGPAK